MRILFDQGTPVPLRGFLPSHTITPVYEIGCSTLQNGDLIRSAEEKGYEVLVTTDRNLKYQQNLKDRKIAIVVLLSTSWPRIQKVVDKVISAIDAALPGTYTEVSI